jgi:hypothetical protein
MASYLFAQSSRANREAEIEQGPLTEKLPRGIKVRAFIHRPRVVEPNHLGECTLDDSDPTGFGPTGWHLSEAKPHYGPSQHW